MKAGAGGGGGVDDVGPGGGVEVELQAKSPADTKTPKTRKEFMVELSPVGSDELALSTTLGRAVHGRRKRLRGCAFRAHLGTSKIGYERSARANGFAVPSGVARVSPGRYGKRMAPRTVLPLLVLFASSACGGGGESEPAPLNSHAELCAGAAPRYLGGYATSAACPFSQQADNIARFGTSSPSGAALYDAKGALVAKVAGTCDSWASAVDAQGVSVIIDTSTGKVVSHGLVHAGQPLTSLPAQLDLPLQVR